MRVSVIAVERKPLHLDRFLVRNCRRIWRDPEDRGHADDGQHIPPWPDQLDTFREQQHAPQVWVPAPAVTLIVSPRAAFVRQVEIDV